MEDREVSGYEDHSISGQLSATLHDHAVTSQELSKLSAVLSSALPGGDTTASGLGISIPRLDNRTCQSRTSFNLQPSVKTGLLNQPTDVFLHDNDFATDYGLFVSKLPVTIAKSGVGEDITGNTEDDLPLPVCTALPAGHHHFRSGPS